MDLRKNMIEVVVGIIRNNLREVFIAKRQKNQFMSDFWELPGGKVENGEDHGDALKRELFEETGIKVRGYSLTQIIQQQYPEKMINLSVFTINDYSGIPIGKEGQDYTWCDIENFANYKLLPTMWKIIKKVSLPNSYWITPDNHNSSETLALCKEHIANGTKIIQLRSKHQLEKSYIEKYNKLCQLNNVKLILNLPQMTFEEQCDGWHLTTKKLMNFSTKELAEKRLIGASTHNLLEVRHAEKMSMDYISLSPINTTPSHPNTKILGWSAASKIISKSSLPIYLLGGMDKNSMSQALDLGAQGIAGITGV